MLICGGPENIFDEIPRTNHFGHRKCPLFPQTKCCHWHHKHFQICGITLKQSYNHFESCGMFFFFWFVWIFLKIKSEIFHRHKINFLKILHENVIYTKTIHPLKFWMVPNDSHCHFGLDQSAQNKVLTFICWKNQKTKKKFSKKQKNANFLSKYHHISASKEQIINLKQVLITHGPVLLIFCWSVHILSLNSWEIKFQFFFSKLPLSKKRQEKNRNFISQEFSHKTFIN